MDIRNVRHTDAGPLASMGRLLSLAMDPTEVSRDIAKYTSGFYVAGFDDRISGFLVMREESPPICVRADSPIQLWRIYVAPDFQGTTVAARLMAQSLSHARGKGHDVIWLGTSEQNARAISFYRKNGFVIVGVGQLHHSHEDHEDLILCRSL